MSKELKAFRDILGILSAVSRREVNMDSELVRTVQQALQRLEAIDNAEPSKALECLESEKRIMWAYDYDIIKQSLIKAEKEHNSVNLLMQELDCKDFADLRKCARCGYQTFRNAKGSQYHNIIIDEAQEQDFNYKNIVLPFFNELVELLGVNDTDEMLGKIKEQLKALEIIKNKTVDIWLIQNKKTLKQYNSMVDESRQLNEEEFNLLKEVLDNGAD